MVNQPAARTVRGLLTILEVLVDDNRELLLACEFLVLEAVNHVELHEDDACRLSASLASV
jgi:hypothetical protein